MMDLKKTTILHYNQHQLQHIHHPGESSNLTNPEKEINCIKPPKVQEVNNRMLYNIYIYILPLYIYIYIYSYIYSKLK